MWRLALDAGLAEAEAAEVCQLAWLRLSQRMPERPLTPERVGAWLDEVVSREAVALARQRGAREGGRRINGQQANVIHLNPGFGIGLARADRGAMNVSAAHPHLPQARRASEWLADHTRPDDTLGDSSTPPC
jgi:hypothetical protein